MMTLDRWREFLTTPKILTFPRLELIGSDDAPSIVVGAGEVRMVSPTDFAFTLTGAPADIRYALAEIRRQRENPYDGLAARLEFYQHSQHWSNRMILGVSRSVQRHPLLPLR